MSSCTTHNCCVLCAVCCVLRADLVPFDEQLSHVEAQLALNQKLIERSHDILSHDLQMDNQRIGNKYLKLAADCSKEAGEALKFLLNQPLKVAAHGAAVVRARLISSPSTSSL